MQKVVSAIKTLLEASVADDESPLYGIKRVFFGDPMIIPESDLPALAIQPMSTDFALRGSRVDQKTHTVEIRLIYNQKDYFGANLSVSKTITAANFSSSSIEFTATAHWYSVGDAVVVSKITPEGYNGTYLITAKTANTFTVAKTIDPWSYSAGGIAQKATNDKVFAIEDAINKVEMSDDNHWTARSSVCGVIQGNPTLPYSVGAETRQAADLAKIVSVNYSLTESRWFPTFEVVTTVQAVVIGDR